MAKFPRRELAMTNPLEVSEPEADPGEERDDEHIDRKVPPKIMRLTQHLHNMIYIRFFYEQIGQQPPEWTKRELTRAEAHLKDELEREEGQGGAFHDFHRRSE
jgi:hypothetical protein